MQGNLLLGLPVAMTVLSIITVSIRFYVRSTGNLGPDDWTMLLALVSFISKES